MPLFEFRNRHRDRLERQNQPMEEPSDIRREQFTGIKYYKNAAFVTNIETGEVKYMEERQDIE